MLLQSWRCIKNRYHYLLLWNWVKNILNLELWRKVIFGIKSLVSGLEEGYHWWREDGISLLFLWSLFVFLLRFWILSICYPIKLRHIINLRHNFIHFNPDGHSLKLNNNLHPINPDILLTQNKISHNQL